MQILSYQLAPAESSGERRRLAIVVPAVGLVLSGNAAAVGHLLEGEAAGNGRGRMMLAAPAVRLVVRAEGTRPGDDLVVEVALEVVAACLEPPEMKPARDRDRHISLRRRSVTQLSRKVHPPAVGQLVGRQRAAVGRCHRYLGEVESSFDRHWPFP